MTLSEFIVEAMGYVDRALDKINPDSVNRSKVRSKINISVISQAKKLITLPEIERQKTVDSIYRKCLASELFKG